MIDIKRIKTTDFKDISQLSGKTYSYHTKEFINFLTNNKSATKDDIMSKFKRHLIDKDYKPNTINFKLSVANQLLKINNIKFKMTRNIKTADYQRSIMSESEIKRVIRIMRNSLNIDENKFIIRDLLIFSFLVSTGLRISELLNIKIKDITQREDRTIVNIRAKGYITKDNIIVINDQLSSIIYDYYRIWNINPNCQEEKTNFLIRNRKHNRLSRATADIIIKKVLKATGTFKEGISLHSLRASFASLLINKGTSIIQIKDALHHRHINTTLKYIKNTERIKDAPELKLNDLLK